MDSLTAVNVTGSTLPRNGLPRIVEGGDPQPGALPSKGSRFVLILASLACLLLSAHFFFDFVVPQTPGRMTRASASLTSKLRGWSWIVSWPVPIPRSAHLLAACLIAFGLVGFAAYGLAVYLAWNRPAHLGSLIVVVGAALLSFLMAAGALPNVNTDIYAYMGYARVAAVYHRNPYEVPPDRFPNDPILPYMDPQYILVSDNKLPTWQSISILLASLAGSSVIVNLFVYRFTFLILNAANTAAIAVILRKLQPQRLLAGIVIYAWNPIVGIYGQSKTDTVMVFFLLLSILLLVTAHRRLAVLALGLSALVKLITLPLVAVYGLRELRLRKWRQLAVDVLLLGLIAVFLYAPFWRDPALFLEHLGTLRDAASLAPSLARPVLAVLFLLLILWAGFAQDGSHAKLLRGWRLVVLFFSLLLSPIAFSWYLMTLIALVSLAADWPVVAISIAVAFASFLLNSFDVVSTKAFPLPDLIRFPRPFVYLGFLSLVVLSVAAAAVFRRRVRRGQETRPDGSLAASRSRSAADLDRNEHGSDFY